MRKYLIVLCFIVLCLATATFGINKKYWRPQINTVGLIGRWKLHDGTAFDYSLRGHNGTLTGTNLTYKYPGIDLPGTNEYIVIADHADFSPILTPFSISAWVYMHAAENFIIASKGEQGVDFEWEMANDTDGKFLAQLYNETDDKWIAVRYSVALTGYINQWIHLVMTYSGGTTDSSIKLYLNTVQVDDTNVGSGNFTGVENLAHTVKIGHYLLVYADGLIDDVMIFNVEKSATEVLSIYSSQRHRYSR